VHARPSGLVASEGLDDALGDLGSIYLHNLHVVRGAIPAFIERCVSSLRSMFGSPFAGAINFETSYPSRKDERLWRRGVKSCDRQRCQELFGVKWGLALSRYFYLTGTSDLVDRFLPVFRLCRRNDEAEMIECFKEVSRLSTEYSVLCGFSPVSYLMDLHVLAGYDTVLNRVDVMQNIAREIGVEPAPIADHLQQRMMKRIAEIVSANFRFGKSFGNFSEFVGFRDAWSTPGATTLPGKVLLRAKDGSTLGVKGKLATSLLFSDDYLVSNAKTLSGAVVKPFRKEDEKVKTRIVYGYDFFSFLRCSFIDSLMTGMEGAGEWCPIGYRSREKFAMRETLVSAASDVSNVCVSLDQSAFDTRQRKEWVSECIRSIYAACEAHYRTLGLEDLADEVSCLMEAELFSFEHAHAGEVPWKVGVPSGHKWTAVIDSVLNRAAAELVAEDLNFSVVCARYQGDDAVLIGRPGASLDFAGAYERLGLKVNSLKTWIARGAFDFLHEIYRDGLVMAFPARVGSSLVWKKPVMGSFIQSKSARVFERAGDLLKGVRRGLIGCKCVAEGMVRRFLDEVGVVRSRATELEMLDTPRFLGGLGFGVDGRVRLSLSGGRVMWERYSLDSKIPVAYGGRSGLPALVDRLSQGVFLRTTPLSASLTRLRGLAKASGYSGFGDGKPLQRSFRWDEGVRWSSQLRFESGVRGYRFTGVLPIPDPRLRHVTSEVAVRCYQVYERAVRGFTPSMEGPEDTGEQWSTIADKVNRMWAYSVFLLLYSGFKNLCHVSTQLMPTLQRMLLGAISVAGCALVVKV